VIKSEMHLLNARA